MQCLIIAVCKANAPRYETKSDGVVLFVGDSNPDRDVSEVTDGCKVEDGGKYFKWFIIVFVVDDGKDGRVFEVRNDNNFIFVLPYSEKIPYSVCLEKSESEVAEKKE